MAAVTDAGARAGGCPTDPFTTLEFQNMLHNSQTSRSPDCEALNLRKGRSGCRDDRSYRGEEAAHKNARRAPFPPLPSDLVFVSRGQKFINSE